MISMRERAIAGQVQAWREYRALSQRALAAAAGVAPVLVQKIEAGSIADPRLSSLRKLAAALGATVGELVDGATSTGRRAARKRARGK